MAIELHGMRVSVYVRVARMALHEKGVPYRLIEIDPFSPDMPKSYLGLHPFRRVPALVHDGFSLYETGAITRYVDEAFDGPRLQPETPRPRARMAQILAVIDNYGYWPLVRQVYSHSVFLPQRGLPAVRTEIEAGLKASERVLTAIEALIEPRGFLVGSELTLADLHLAPMIAYFDAAEEGRALLARHARLSKWWNEMSSRQSVVETEPQAPA
jgi:glutathione S-transferase